MARARRRGRARVAVPMSAGLVEEGEDEEGVDEPAISEQELVAIDTEFRALLPALDRCASGRIAALVTGRTSTCLSLLAFHLHLRWPDSVRWLPLTPTVAALPFTSVDLATARAPTYRLLDALVARRRARSLRHAERRGLRRDLVLTDWEMGTTRDGEPVEDIVLPPSAFLRIGRVRPDGSISDLPRPVIGRHAARDAPCPRVLVPGARELSPRAVRALADADFLLIDVRRVRGRRALRSIRSVLDARPTDRPSLIVINSPSDALALGFGEPEQLGPLLQVGSPSKIEDVRVLAIGRDRLAAEERFRAAVNGLPEQSASAERLVALADHAWWATRQAITPEGGARERRRFERALDGLARNDALTATLFASARDLLGTAAADEGVRSERLQAAVKLVTAGDTPGPILVIARTSVEVSALRRAIAESLEVAVTDLEALDVRLCHVRSPLPPTGAATAVMVGYPGMIAIDALVSSGAPTIGAVLDPVEARVAWFHAQRMATFLEGAGAPAFASPHRRLAVGLAPHVAGFSDVRELVVEGISGIDIDSMALLGGRPAAGEAFVYLMDGSRLEVSLGARFERVGRSGVGSGVVTAKELAPGDQVVLLDEGAHASFSERRRVALDAGFLQRQNQSRATWLAIVRAIANSTSLTPSSIAEQLEEHGCSVTPSAVSSWLADDTDAHIPRQLETFLAFARVLGLRLPDDTLRQYHRDIREWRFFHRRAGREVAKAIRLAYTGRLGAATLARIEKDWGLGIRALLDAAQIGVVDEVVLPEDTLLEQEDPRAVDTTER